MTSEMRDQTSDPGKPMAAESIVTGLEYHLRKWVCENPNREVGDPSR
jgi:hypothetical protein